MYIHTYMFAIYRNLHDTLVIFFIILELPEDNHSLWPKYVVMLIKTLDSCWK